LPSLRSLLLLLLLLLLLRLRLRLRLRLLLQGPAARAAAGWRL
jgi:hypothetical protein